MKRKLIFALWIILFFVFISVNCNAQSSGSDQRIVGTWVSNVKVRGSDYTITLMFNANGSGTATVSSGGQSGTITFIYGVSIKGELAIAEQSDSFDFLPDGKMYFSPDGKIMFVDTRYIFRKK